MKPPWLWLTVSLLQSMRTMTHSMAPQTRMPLTVTRLMMTIKDHVVADVVVAVVVVAVVAVPKVARRIQNLPTTMRLATMRSRLPMQMGMVTRPVTDHIVVAVVGLDVALAIRQSLVKMIRRTRLCAYVSRAAAPQKPVLSRVPRA